MKRVGIVLLACAFSSVYACDNTDWAAGTFVGTNDTMRLSVFNEPNSEKYLQLKVGAARCVVPAAITVNGKSMKVNTIPRTLPGCDVDNVVLVRVTDRTARTTYNGVVLEMQKQ